MNLVHSQIMVQLIRHGIIHDNHGKMPIVTKFSLSVRRTKIYTDNDKVVYIT